MGENLFFWASQSFGAQLSCSPCFASYGDGPLYGDAETASYTWHLSAVSLSNHPLPAPSTPSLSVKRAKSLFLPSLLFVVSLGTTVALAALTGISVNSCVWARQQLIIHWFLWECPLLLRLATTSIMISTDMGINNSLPPSYHSDPEKRSSVL